MPSGSGTFSYHRCSPCILDLLEWFRLGEQLLNCCSFAHSPRQPTRTGRDIYTQSLTSSLVSRHHAILVHVASSCLDVVCPLHLPGLEGGICFEAHHLRSVAGNDPANYRVMFSCEGPGQSILRLEEATTDWSDVEENVWSHDTRADFCPCQNAGLHLQAKTFDKRPAERIVSVVGHGCQRRGFPLWV